MSYLSTLKTAFLLFPFVAFIVTIPFILIEYHKYGSISKIRVLIIYSFILYLLLFSNVEFTFINICIYLKNNIESII